MSKDIEVEEFINRMYKIFAPYLPIYDFVKSNLTRLEYYFRQKFYGKTINSYMAEDILSRFEWSLVEGGEPVGMKASLTIASELTQSTLSAIHAAHGQDIRRKTVIESSGIQRWQELLTGTIPASKVLTFNFYDNSKKNVINFINLQETIYFNQIWISTTLILRNSPLDTLISDLHPSINFSSLEYVNKYYVKMLWKLTLISEFEIHIVNIINKLKTSYPDIYFITGNMFNIDTFEALVFFKENLDFNDIFYMMEEWKETCDNTVMNGGYIRNCTLMSRNNISPQVGLGGQGLTTYYLKANEVAKNCEAFENLIIHPSVNPFGSRSSVPADNLALFGINEATVMLYDDLKYCASNQSETSEILDRHIKLLADNTASSGSFITAFRSSVIKDDRMDLFRKLNFEDVGKFIDKTILQSRKYEANDLVSASFFGNLNEVGTGYAKIVLYPVNNSNILESSQSTESEQLINDEKKK
jgi:hypothetical protein